MDLKLKDGDYVPDGRGSFERVSGYDELLQRVLFKLTARRGAFPVLPELGSRLHLIARELPSNRQAAASQYVAEALSDEADLTVTEVRLDKGAFDSAQVTVCLEYHGEPLYVTVAI